MSTIEEAPLLVPDLEADAQTPDDDPVALSIISVSGLANESGLNGGWGDVPEHFEVFDQKVDEALNEVPGSEVTVRVAGDPGIGVAALARIASSRKVERVTVQDPLGESVTVTQDGIVGHGIDTGEIEVSLARSNDNVVNVVARPIGNVASSALVDVGSLTPRAFPHRADLPTVKVIGDLGEIPEEATLSIDKKTPRIVAFTLPVLLSMAKRARGQRPPAVQVDGGSRWLSRVVQGNQDVHAGDPIFH